VTDAVMAEVSAWQARPLEPMYPVVFFDALRVKIREDAVVRNKAIYLALGIRREARAAQSYQRLKAPVGATRHSRKCQRLLRSRQSRESDGSSGSGPGLNERQLYGSPTRPAGGHQRRVKDPA
jgi:hypothetical protein